MYVSTTLTYTTTVAARTHIAHTAHTLHCSYMFIHHTSYLVAQRVPRTRLLVQTHAAPSRRAHGEPNARGRVTGTSHGRSEARHARSHPGRAGGGLMSRCCRREARHDSSRLDSSTQTHRQLCVRTKLVRTKEKKKTRVDVRRNKRKI